MKIREFYVQYTFIVGVCDGGYLHNSVGPKVIWVNPRKILISLEDRRTIDDHRISVERFYTKDWNLLIRQVRYNDSGTYECRVNTQPKQVKKVMLTVQGQ